MSGAVGSCGVSLWVLPFALPVLVLPLPVCVAAAHAPHRLPLLEEAWKLKEALRDWYAMATAETAAEQLDQWIAQVQASACDPLKTTLTAFRRWRQGILAFFTYRISNGFVEGKNNRTKMMMRRSYGFKNRHHLRLRILAGNLP